MTAYFEGLGYASYLVGEHDLLHLTPGSLATIGSFKDWSSGTVETAVSLGQRGATGHWQLPWYASRARGCSTHLRHRREGLVRRRP